MHLRREGPNPDYPLTLDLRRAPEPWLQDAAPPRYAATGGGDSGSAKGEAQQQAQQ